MRNFIYSSITLLLLAMLLLSACRAARSAEKEETVTQTAESSQSSVTNTFSFADLFRSMSLRADSIVMWMQYDPAVGFTNALGQSAYTSTEKDSLWEAADSNLLSLGSGFTAQYTGSPLASAQPSQRVRSAKVLIGGLHLESQANEQKVTSSHARDTLSARESRDSSLSESSEEKPPNNLARAYIIICILLLVILFPAAIQSFVRLGVRINQKLLRQGFGYI